MAETTSGKSRTPKCARCRNHGYTVNLRGHKGFCPHITCTCNLCDLVKERQEVSKRQIKLRRRQQQEEVMGMYVPVPPSVFSRGSISGINLDYLRVVFPRKRVDRLYAVLLQCNNDINAAVTKLHQEENTAGGADVSQSREKTKSSTHAVMKISKGTQWSPDTSLSNTPPKSRGDITKSPAEACGQQHRQEKGKEAGCGQNPPASTHCLLPYFWPHPAVPAQFTPGDPVSLSSHDVFGRALPAMSSRPQPRYREAGAGLGLETALTPTSCSDSLVSVTSCASFAKRCCTSQGNAREGLIQQISCAAVIPPAPQVPPWSMPNIGVCGLGASAPQSATPRPVSLASQISQSGEGTYTSAPAGINWPDVQASSAPLLTKRPVPFSLPPTPFPAFPSTWPSNPLPPLSYLPTSMPPFFPCGQFSGPFQAPCQAPDASSLAVGRDTTTFTDGESNVLRSPDISEPLEDIAVCKSEVRVVDNTCENAETSESEIDVLDVCGKNSREFIDPAGL